MPDTETGTAASLESAWEKRRAENEATRAAQLAADSVPTTDIDTLRERATRHAHESVDRYWGHFDDIQTALGETVISPLLETVSRLVAEHEPYEGLTDQGCEAGKHPTWLIESPDHHACPWCEIDRLRAQAAELESQTAAYRATETERDQLKQRLHDAAMTKTWTNEDGKKFVFVEDIAPTLLGLASK